MGVNKKLSSEKLSEAKARQILQIFLVALNFCKNYSKIEKAKKQPLARFLEDISTSTGKLVRLIAPSKNSETDRLVEKVIGRILSLLKLVPDGCRKSIRDRTYTWMPTLFPEASLR